MCNIGVYVIVHYPRSLACDKQSLAYNHTSTYLFCNPSMTRITQIEINLLFYFLSMRMKQSDWLIRLSQRAVFLRPARCEMQPARCEMQPARCEMTEMQPYLGEKL